MLTAKEIVLGLPKRYKNDPLESTFEGIIHFKLSGNDGGDFTVNVLANECTVIQGLTGEARITISADASTYQAVEYGKKNAMQAILMGEVKVSNFMELPAFTSAFRGLLSTKNKD